MSNRGRKTENTKKKMVQKKKSTASIITLNGNGQRFRLKGREWKIYLKGKKQLYTILKR